MVLQDCSNELVGAHGWIGMCLRFNGWVGWDFDSEGNVEAAWDFGG